MNYRRHVSLVGWETRSSRRQSRALVLCKNYGFTPIVGKVFVGEIYEREERELRSALEKLFTGKADKFFLGAMCASCFNGSMLESRVQREFRHVDGFELIQMPETIKNQAPAHPCRKKDVV